MLITAILKYFNCPEAILQPTVDAALVLIAWGLAFKGLRKVK
jgi:hypothetical protein